MSLKGGKNKKESLIWRKGEIKKDLKGKKNCPESITKTR